MVFPSQDGIESGGVASAGAFGGGTGVSIFSLSNLQVTDSPCTTPDGMVVNEPVVAVAFTPQGLLLAQTREPSQLLVIGDLPWGSPSVLALPGDTRADTGHDLFHRDSGGGIACASCHPEGGEDGHVWHFQSVGPRRTQALHVGLAGTEPFHWDGDQKDLSAIMTSVFVGRMGGVRQTTDRLGVLSDWLFSCPHPRRSATPVTKRCCEARRCSNRRRWVAPRAIPATTSPTI